MRRIQLPYGRRFIEFSLARGRLMGILQKKNAKPGKDIKELFNESMRRWGAGETFKKLVHGKENILICVPDATRRAHLAGILPLVLGMFGSRGRGVDIIVATGLHKKHSQGQLEKLLGTDILKRCRVLNHVQRRSSLMKLGRTAAGIPIVLNKALGSHDFIISIGVIEPHLYAGFSGGAKTIAIGLAGEETINATHSLRFLDDPMMRLGRIDRNPFQDTIREIASRAPADFYINVVNDADGTALNIFSGPLNKVFRKGVNFARRSFEMEVREPADIVICGIGHPKDVNLYQASRAVNYILNVEKPMLKKGGVLIVAARMAEGAGQGKAEKRFYKEVRAMRSPADFIKNVKRRGCIAGVHRAYMIARPLLDYGVAFVTGRGNEGLMRGLPFPCFKNINDALDYALARVGDKAGIYIMPHALSAIARRR